MTNSEEKIDIRDIKAHYTLRSSTFVTKLKELSFFSFRTRVEALAKIDEVFSWTKRNEWGISEVAWEKTLEANISPLYLFLHPRILSEQPDLLAYYRSIALLSQKGFKKILSISIEQIEQGGRVPNRENSLKICFLINEFVSIIIENRETINLEQILGMMFASAGAQIQGAWNNAIGLEGELLVKKLIIRRLLNQGAIKAFSLLNNQIVTELEKPLELAKFIKILLLNNQGSIVFRNEPDIAIYDRNGILKGDVEIKAGIDTGGALERLGAAMKSFENTRRENPNCECFYLCGCITKEVTKRVNQATDFATMYTLNEIIYDLEQQENFINHLLALSFSE
ncbi:MAG: XcyI family restriction endonuclease [Oscillatoria sp. PMC 1068.18]|nr:XcyI family restriction endonuclease [Oscillatoria sp. PMC 1068.18]